MKSHFTLFSAERYTSGGLLLFILLLLNSRIIAGTASNPIGIKGLQEIYYFILLLFSIYYLLVYSISDGKIKAADLTVFSIVILGITYSSAAAYFRFDQPIYYGLMETRRMLAFLVYFPVVWALRINIVTTDEILDSVVIIGIICSLLLILVAGGIISPLHTRDIAENAIRQERFGIGQMYIALSALITIHRFSYKNFIIHTGLFLLFIGVLIIFVQTRQILIGLAFALFVLRGPAKTLIYLGPIVLLVILIVEFTPSLQAIVERYEFLIAQLFSDEYLSGSARARSIAVIINELKNGHLFGSGALSLHYNGGFESVYATHFFLADLGAFGSLYNFGFFALVLYLPYFYLQISLLEKTVDHHNFRLLLAAWSQMLILFPIGAILEYRGYLSGLILAMTLGCLYDMEKTKTIVYQL